jgi:uncharacterized protein
MKHAQKNIQEAPILPTESLSRHIAILGKTGSGKTYAAKGLVERLLNHGRRLCVIDPTGAWWGLRSSADGTGPGFPVIVLGGRHGDAPLPAGSGAACARLVSEQSLQVVFDVSSMSVSERGRWFTGFADEIFRLNSRPLHVVIDEAHMFAPQGRVPDPEVGKMLHAANTLASGGRSRGVRLLMITQRPAKLHKDTLTCADILIAMRVIAPQDREAIEAWVEGAGDRVKAREILDSLANLSVGEGWVWAPDVPILGRGKFPPITTFDSSATPGDEEEIQVPKGRAEVDLSAIASGLEAAADEVKANDPKAMRAEISQLKKELSDERRKPVRIDAGEMGKAQERITELDRELATANGLVAEYAWMLGRLQSIRGTLDGVIRLEGFTSNTMKGSDRSAEVQGGAGTTRALAKATVERPMPCTTTANPTRNLEKGPGLILDAIAWWDRIGTPRPTRAQVAAVAGYAVKGGSFSRYVSTLSSLKYIVAAGGWLSITKEGSGHAAWPDVVPTQEDLHKRVLDILDGGARKILEVLIRRGGMAVGRTEVAELAGYEPTGGSFARYLSTLSSLGVIWYPKRTTAAAVSWLFQEGK